MSRAMEATMSTGLSASVIRPCLVARLDIDTDPIRAWTGPGNYAPVGTDDDKLNGITFVPAAPVMSMSPIVEDQGIGSAVTLTLPGHDLDQTLLQQVIKDKRAWRGKPAYLWLALLDTDEATVIADPIRIKTGVIVTISTVRQAETSEVHLVIDSDLGKARSAPFNWISHSRIYTGDTATTYMVKLGNKPGGFGPLPMTPSEKAQQDAERAKDGEGVIP